MKIIILSLITNLWMVSYGKNDNLCSDCTFNIVANSIDDMEIQSCPVTTGTTHIQSTNEMSAVNCMDDSQNGYYIMNECDITTGTTTFDNSAFDLTIVRRRQLLSEPIMSDYLIQTCIAYDIIGIIPNCLNIKGVFLPLCSDTDTSNLTPSDINQLIMNETFDNGNNVQSAVGANVDGNLGILIELINVDNFEICIGNIIANEHDLHNIYNHRAVEISDGIIVASSLLNNDAVQCNIDGLPCFNFLFRQRCSSDTIFAENEMETGGEVIRNSEINAKIYDNSTDSTDGYLHYNVVIDFSYCTFLYLWSIVLFVMGIICLNMILYRYCSKSESTNSEGESEGEGEDECGNSKVFDIEAV